MKYRIEFELFAGHWSLSSTVRINPAPTIKVAEKEIKYALSRFGGKIMTYRIVNPNGTVRSKLYTRANTLRKAKAANA